MKFAITSLPGNAKDVTLFQSQMHFDDSKILADFTTACPETSGENLCNGRAGKRGKCTKHSRRSKIKFEVSFV